VKDLPSVKRMKMGYECNYVMVKKAARLPQPTKRKKSKRSDSEANENVKGTGEGWYRKAGWQ
jgi:hypothetical protein